MNPAEFRAFVMNPQGWDDATWEQFQTEGLATRRTNRDNSGHKWVLTDAGLDRYIAGARECKCFEASGKHDPACADCKGSGVK